MYFSFLLIDLYSVARLNNQKQSMERLPLFFNKMAQSLQNSLDSEDQWAQMECLGEVENTMQKLDVSKLQLAPFEDNSIIERLDASATLKQISIFGVIATSAEIRQATENRASSIQNQMQIAKADAVALASSSTALLVNSPKHRRIASPSDFEHQRKNYLSAFERMLLL